MSAPAFRSSGVNTTGTTSVTVTAPSGIQDNDILIAAVYNTLAAATVTSAPSGFTQKLTFTAAGSRMSIYWKRASSESGNYAFGASSAAFMACNVMAISGAVTSGDPFGSVGSGDTATGTVVKASGITILTNESLLLFIDARTTNGAHSGATGLTERYDSGFLFADRVVKPGPTGDYRAIIDASEEWLAVMLELKAASPAADPAVTYFGQASSPADGAAATDGAGGATPAVTPPANMRTGDLALLIAWTRDATGVSMAMSQSSGQSWTALAAVSTTNMTGRVFWCRFNGTWGSDPSVAVTGGTSPYTAVLLAFRPMRSSSAWAVDQTQVELDIAAPSTPFTGSVTGQTPTKPNCLTVAGWFSADDNTWANISGDAWMCAGTTQYRNTSGSDQSGTFAFCAANVAAATGNVSKDQATLGGDASTTFIVTFYEVVSGSGYQVSQAVKRAAYF